MGSLARILQHSIQLQIPRLTYSLQTNTEGVLPTEIGKYLQGYEEYEPAFGVLIAPLKTLYKRAVVDLYRYGNAISGLTIPCLIQATSRGGGFLGYGLSSSSITQDFLNTSYTHSYLAAMLRATDFLQMTSGQFPDLIGEISREIDAYDKLEIDYTIAFLIERKGEECYDWIAGHSPSDASWTFKECLDLDVWGDSFPHELGSYYEVKAGLSPSGHAGADWYDQSYDDYIAENNAPLGNTLKIRPSTSELLAWEVPKEDVRYYSNGQIDRYPKVTLNSLSIELEWTNIIRNYLETKGDGNAWLTYEAHSSYGKMFSDAIQVRSSTQEKSTVDIDLSSFIIWDAELHAESDDLIEVTTPYLITLIWMEDPEALSNELFGIGVNQLDEAQYEKLVQSSHSIIASQFTGVPLEVDQDYIHRYNTISHIPVADNVVDIILRVVVFTVGALMTYYGKDPASKFFGIDMMLIAITEHGIIDYAVIGMAHLVGAEEWYSFSLYSFATWSVSSLTTWINLGFNIALFLAMSYAINNLYAVFKGYSSYKEFLELTHLREELRAAQRVSEFKPPSDIKLIEQEQTALNQVNIATKKAFQGVIDDISIRQLREINNVLKEFASMNLNDALPCIQAKKIGEIAKKIAGKLDPTLGEIQYFDVGSALEGYSSGVGRTSIIPSVNRFVNIPNCVLPEGVFGLGMELTVDYSFKLAETFMERLGTHVVTGTVKPLIPLMAFSPITTGGLALAGKVAAPMLSKFAYSYVYWVLSLAEVALWNIVFRGGFTSIISLFFYDNLEQNPYTWAGFDQIFTIP